MTFVSYAQNFEDVLLFRALRHVVNGQYIDVGAGHPDELSVTKAFYERGWSGIDLEPSPEYASALRNARPRDTVLQTAVGNEIGRAAFHHVRGTGLSTLVQSIAESHCKSGRAYETLATDVTTLTAVCEKHVRGD